MALEELVKRSRPPVMEKRLAAAYSQKRWRVEFSVPHFVGQLDIKPLRRGVCGGDVATITLVVEKDVSAASA